MVLATLVCQGGKGREAFPTPDSLASLDKRDREEIQDLLGPRASLDYPDFLVRMRRETSPGLWETPDFLD